MTLTLEAPPTKSVNYIDQLVPTVVAVTETVAKPDSLLDEIKQNVSEDITKALKGTMSPEEKLHLGMEMSALQGLIELRAVGSLEPATVSGDGITEGQAEEATIDMVMGVMAEIVADVYTEQSGTISGRVLEMFRKSKVHHRLGRYALGGVAGASAVAVTLVSAPVAVPAVVVGTGVRALTGRLREGLDKKINKLPVEKVQEINRQLESFEGIEDDREAYRSLLVANLLLEPLKADLLESAYRSHLDPEAGEHVSDHRLFATEISKVSNDYVLNLFGLSGVRSVSEPERVRQHERSVRVLATEYHDAWREEYTRDYDGEHPSRLEPTSDIKWIRKNGSSTVDLLATSFQDLPEDWKVENISAAETVLEIISEFGSQIDLKNPKIRDQVGRRVHEAWLARQNNAEDHALNKPYEELSKEEQEKDIRQVEIALGLMDRINIY